MMIPFFVAGKMDRYLTSKQAAELTGFSEGYLRRVRCKSIKTSLESPPYSKAGYSVRYLESEVRKWMESYRIS